MQDTFCHSRHYRVPSASPDLSHKNVASNSLRFSSFSVRRSKGLIFCFFFIQKKKHIQYVVAILLKNIINCYCVQHSKITASCRASKITSCSTALTEKSYRHILRAFFTGSDYFPIKIATVM